MQQMSKLNAQIKHVAQSLCSEFGVDYRQLKYGGETIESALDKGFLAADVVFQMQHIAATFTCYVDCYLVIDIAENTNEELFDVVEKTMATEEQKRVLIDYYADNHPRFSSPDAQLNSFILYASVRCALFNWKDTTTSRLAFSQMRLRLDEGISVIDHVEVAMKTLRQPNRLMHLSMSQQIPVHHAPQQPTSEVQQTYEAEPN